MTPKPSERHKAMHDAREEATIIANGLERIAADLRGLNLVREYRGFFDEGRELLQRLTELTDRLEARLAGKEIL